MCAAARRVSAPSRPAQRNVAKTFSLQARKRPVRSLPSPKAGRALARAHQATSGSDRNLHYRGAASLADVPYWRKHIPSDRIYFTLNEAISQAGMNVISFDNPFVFCALPRSCKRRGPSFQVPANGAKFPVEVLTQAGNSRPRRSRKRWRFCHEMTASRHACTPMNTLLIHEGIYTQREFEKLFAEWSSNQKRRAIKSAWA